jgi:hypothetical protein
MHPTPGVRVRDEPHGSVAQSAPAEREDTAPSILSILFGPCPSVKLSPAYHNLRKTPPQATLCIIRTCRRIHMIRIIVQVTKLLRSSRRLRGDCPRSLPPLYRVVAKYSFETTRSRVRRPESTFFTGFHEPWWACARPRQRACRAASDGRRPICARPNDDGIYSLDKTSRGFAGIIPDFNGSSSGDNRLQPHIPPAPSGQGGVHDPRLRRNGSALATGRVYDPG